MTLSIYLTLCDPQTDLYTKGSEGSYSNSCSSPFEAGHDSDHNAFHLIPIYNLKDQVNVFWTVF